jgi:hypothetical protein
MKTKCVFFLLAILLSMIAIMNFACKNVNKNLDNNGLEINELGNGRVEKTLYFEDGNIEYRFQTFKNLMDGVSEEFYPNGRIKVRTFWKNGKQGFLYEKYSDDGTPLTIRRKILISKIDSKKFNICLSDTLKDVVMFICDYKDNFIEGKNIVIPVEDGVGTITFLKASKNTKIKGVIRVVRDKNLFEESYPFELNPDTLK